MYVCVFEGYNEAGAADWDNYIVVVTDNVDECHRCINERIKYTRIYIFPSSLRFCAHAYKLIRAYDITDVVIGAQYHTDEHNAMAGYNIIKKRIANRINSVRDPCIRFASMVI